LFNRVVFLYIPYIRGYYSWRGDNISHLGILRDILILGHIPSETIYPITHILLSELVYATGFPIKIIVNHSTALFSIFYVISIYLLATSSLATKKEQIFAATSIVCVLFNGYDVYLMPNGWSLLYLPFVIFLYFRSLVKKHSLEYTILFFIMLLLYPFFHPLSAFILILILVSIGFIDFLIPIIKKKTFLVNISPLPLTPILLETVIFLPWLLSFQKFNLNLKIMYNSITTGSSPDIIGSMSNTVNKLSLNELEFIELFIKLMGSESIFLIFFLLSFILVFKYPNDRKEHKYLIMLLCITFLFALMYTFYLFSIVPGLQSIGSGRLQAYLVIFTPIFVGFVLAYIINKKIVINRLNLSPVICVIIIFTASTLSIYSVHPSPYVINPNMAITQMDINGAEWFLNFKNPTINNVFIASPMHRFSAGILGTIESEKLLGPSYRERKIEDHLNYTASNNLGSSYTQNKYCMITMYDRMVYDTVWKVVGRFNKDDFKKLEKDISVDKIYSNDETNIFYIHKFS
jgi:hypothetical protein